ncbi:hypothetical protein ACLK1Z_01160 [Escherichia coli]
MTVLAANNTGYQNLTLLISKAYQRGMICRADHRSRLAYRIK